LLDEPDGISAVWFEFPTNLFPEWLLVAVIQSVKHDSPLNVHKNNPGPQIQLFPPQYPFVV
jgi:hypothetical protein